MEKIKKYSFVILILITFAFILFHYSDVITKPNTYMFSKSGDAMKNYFTFASHIKENTVVESHIMNYPYGENYLYLDCQPALTIVLQKLSCIFPGITNYAVGITNYIMILSILFSAIFIYLIFIRLKVDSLIAVLGAFAIAVLAPQIARITGHLALSYSFFIPLSWYLYLRLFSSDKTPKWSILLGFNNLFWYFVHGYMGMILILFFILCFFFNYIFYQRKKNKKLKYLLSFGLSVIIPFLLFWLYMSLTDSHCGRTNDPIGFFDFRTNFASIFLPTHLRAPMFEFFKRVFKPVRTWEGFAYVGMGTLLVLLLILLNTILKLFKSKYSLFDNALLYKSKFIIVSLCAAICVSLFANALPFRWGLEFLLEWFKMIKNFRAVGRFAWVFYYVATVSSIYILYQIYNAKKQKIYLILLILLPISYVYEGFVYHSDFSSHISTEKNLFNKNLLSESMLNGLELADSSIYQAIIPVPFYHIGAESYEKGGTDKIYQYSMALAYHSRIPILSNYSTKTSIWETRNIMQVLAPGFYKKQIEKDIKSDKPFLVVYSNEDILECETQLLEKCEKLYEDDNYSLYSISKEKLFYDTSDEAIAEFEAVKPSLYTRDSFLISSSDSTSSVFFDNYDNIAQDITFSGEGAFKGEFQKYNLLADLPTYAFKQDTDYILSFWMYNGGKNFGQDAVRSFLHVEYDHDGVVELLAFANPNNSVVITDKWSLVELPFTIYSNAKRVTITIVNGYLVQDCFYVDNLLIREKGVDVYKVLESEKGETKSLFKNNHIIKIDK